MENKNNQTTEKSENKKFIDKNDNEVKFALEKLNNKVDLQFDKLNQNISNTNRLMHWIVIVFGLVSVGLIIYMFTMLFVK